jgi:hypothetical protein
MTVGDRLAVLLAERDAARGAADTLRAERDALVDFADALVTEMRRARADADRLAERVRRIPDAWQTKADADALAAHDAEVAVRSPR